MDIAAIEDLRGRYWQQGFGTISADEALFIQSVIHQHKPRTFLEIGMASGLSTGIICKFLDRNHGEKLVSIDFDNTFFFDKTKENGYLVDEITQGCSVEVVKRPFTISLDICEEGVPFDMAFIDANHMHPWPTIDTLALLPVVQGSKIILHHDYNLFALQKEVRGIGPKYLFDQFPESQRYRATANDGNIFYLRAYDDIRSHSKALAESFLLPWSIKEDPFKNAGPNSSLHDLEARLTAIMRRFYDDIVLQAFQEGLSRHRDRLAAIKR